MITSTALLKYEEIGIAASKFTANTTLGIWSVYFTAKPAGTEGSKNIAQLCNSIVGTVLSTVCLFQASRMASFAHNQRFRSLVVLLVEGLIARSDLLLVCAGSASERGWGTTYADPVVQSVTHALFCDLWKTAHKFVIPCRWMSCSTNQVHLYFGEQRWGSGSLDL